MELTKSCATAIGISCACFLEFSKYHIHDVKMRCPDQRVVCLLRTFCLMLLIVLLAQHRRSTVCSQLLSISHRLKLMCFPFYKEKIKPLCKKQKKPSIYRQFLRVFFFFICFLVKASMGYQGTINF